MVVSMIRQILKIFLPPLTTSDEESQSVSVVFLYTELIPEGDCPQGSALGAIWEKRSP